MKYKTLFFLMVFFSIWSHYLKSGEKITNINLSSTWTYQSPKKNIDLSIKPKWHKNLGKILIQPVTFEWHDISLNNALNDIKQKFPSLNIRSDQNKFKNLNI